MGLRAESSSKMATVHADVFDNPSLDGHVKSWWFTGLYEVPTLPCHPPCFPLINPLLPPSVSSSITPRASSKRDGSSLCLDVAVVLRCSHPPCLLSKPPGLVSKPTGLFSKPTGLCPNKTVKPNGRFPPAIWTLLHVTWVERFFRWLSFIQNGFGATWRVWV